MAVNGLGIGGTEKAVQTHALNFDRSKIDVAVVGVHESGSRQSALVDAGIEVHCAEGDERRLTELFEGADVVHVTRAGVSEPLVPAAARAARVQALVESNVFGAVDASADRDEFSCHLVPSKMCALRYRQRRGLQGPEFHDRHRVLHWPLDLERLRANAPDPREARERLGLDPDREVVIRVGRANDRKWRNLLVDMVPPLLELAPEAQVVIVGATPEKLRRMQRLDVLDRVHLYPATADEEELARYYAAADVFVTAAEIGESHSVAIEEAMGLGLPVVTCSTPWVDNAQIEQVDEGRTGHIADHPLAFAEAVASLLADAERRREFGDRAREKAETLYEAELLTRQLERLYASLLEDGAAPSEWIPSPAEVDAFGAEYERRLQAGFRPLTTSEQRLEVDD